MTTEAARARVAASFRHADTLKSPISQVSRPKDGVELSEEDHKVLSLRNRGLWPSEIAVLLRMPVRSVNYRLERLKKGGFTFPRQQLLDQFPTAK